MNIFFNDDRQNNTRVGSAFNFPVGELGAIKVAYSTGAIIRIGVNFSTIPAAGQMVFF